MFENLAKLAALRMPLNSLRFNGLFSKSTVPGRKAVPKGRPGTPARIAHFNWRAKTPQGGPRPAWTYRGARRNMMKMKRRAA